MTAATTLAEQHDSAGRHDDAINTLARAAQKGDVEAMTELGKRLVIGDRAPLLPKDGVRLLLDATKAASVEAPAHVATMVALGVYVPQSWSEALGLLVLAAERGSESARGQLATLADQPIPVGNDRAVWRQLAEVIDLRWWLTAPSSKTLSTSPVIRVFRDFVTDPVCAWLIERARPKLQRALIYDPVGGEDLADHMRTNTAAGFNLMEADVVQVAVQTRMSAAIGVPVQHMEGPTVLHYAPGEEITNHYDFVNPRVPNYDAEIAQRGQRIITFLVYLNEDYEGGETDFPEQRLRYRGGRRDGLFFTNALPNGEPDLRMLHAGFPPRDGDKWLFSQFVRNRPAVGVQAEPETQ